MTAGWRPPTPPPPPPPPPPPRGGGGGGRLLHSVHLSEALAAELGLAAEGLLSDERVRSDRARVDLVVHEVRELQHVNEADADLLLETLAGHTVVEIGLAVVRQAGGLELRLDLRLRGAVEHRRGEVEAERARGPPEARLENLNDVHRSEER